MPLDGWKKLPSGDVECFPVVGWESTVIHDGMGALLRLEFATTPAFDQFDSSQLLMTGAQARELAAMLMRLADTMDRITAASTSGLKSN